jgi:hypothetical protein
VVPDDVASTLAMLRSRPGGSRSGRDLSFLLGLVAVFGVQVWKGVDVLRGADVAGGVNTIAILVVICFTIGVARAWELVSGPSFALTQELTALWRRDENGGESQAGPDAAGT